MMPGTLDNAVVMGLGVTGLSCVRHLAPRVAHLCVTDSRARPPGAAALAADWPDVESRFGGFDEARILAADLVAVSPGIPADEPVLESARAAGVDVAGDVELFARAARGPVAGITGTNGKSTVTTLLGAILAAAGRRVAVGGNLGTPALDLLVEAPRDGYVLELSSFQLDLVSHLELACAAVLNLSPDHLDRYAGLEAYAASKRRIYDHAQVAVFNADDPATAPPEGFPGRRIGVRAGPPGPDEWGLVDRAGAAPLLQSPDGPLLGLDELPMAGRHNGFNALAAMAMAESLGVPAPDAVDAVRRHVPLPHRCTLVAEAGGVRWIDDSKATNIGACRSALLGLDDGRCSLILIAGGLGKGADFHELRPAVEGRVRAAVLIGTDAPAIEQALAGACRIELAGSMDEAVARAADLAVPGDRVLLAPACASFDMFASYAERGDAFVAAVRRRPEMQEVPS